MYAENFVLLDYLKRINLDASFVAAFQPNFLTLKTLMQAQLFHVPFENIDVQCNKSISLVPEDIVQKIVYQPRGGYCYEVNGLFACALNALGVKYTMVAARPMFYPMRRPKTHMALVVHLPDGDYLCDLGFGSYGIREPLSLATLDQTVSQGFDRFRLTMLDASTYLMQAWQHGEWTNQYAFDLYAHEMIDFLPANYLNSTHPDTIFVQKLLVVKHHLLGRDILLGHVLKEIRVEGVRETQLSDEQRKLWLITQGFLIDIVECL